LLHLQEAQGSVTLGWCRAKAGGLVREGEEELHSKAGMGEVYLILYLVMGTSTTLITSAPGT